jgi:hypothetical protein
MKKNKVTSIKVYRSTINKLRDFELHPRESNESIILRAIEKLYQLDLDDFHRKKKIQEKSK